MSDVALETLTREAVALPYSERVDLLNSIARSLYQTEERNSEQKKQERIQRRLTALRKVAGSGKELWKGVDALEYQRKLREERDIG